MQKVILILLLIFGGGFFLRAQLPGITDKVKNTRAFPGYFHFYWDEKEGKIWLEIDKWDTEFLYVKSLPAGVGSNDIG